MAIIILGTMGLVAGTALVVAFRFIAPPIDERIEKITDALPGANCGGCGFPGCAGFAEALVKKNIQMTGCAPGGAESMRQIAKIMGVEAAEVEPKTAMVLCAGDHDKAKEKYVYEGVATCVSASAMAGGPKLCPDGCLGYGDCREVCVFDAIHVTDKGLAVVDREKCTGCAKCVDACPKGIIKLVPRWQQVFVLCSTKLTAKEVKKFCSVGCTGCKLCTKECNYIKMDGALAVVADDIKEDDRFPEEAALVCQSGSLLDTAFYDPLDWATKPEKREDWNKRSTALKEERKAARAAAKAAKAAKAPEADEDKPADKKVEK